MSTDKRSVATDALETLGTIIGNNEKRDAIHLGVEPVTAAHLLSPGDHIGIDSAGMAVNVRYGAKALGIVDPFLINDVQKGEKF